MTNCRLAIWIGRDLGIPHAPVYKTGKPQIVTIFWSRFGAQLKFNQSKFKGDMKFDPSKFRQSRTIGRDKCL